MDYEEVSEYVEKLIGDGGDLLAWVYKKSSELRSEGVHSIDPPRGRLLELVARLMVPKRVLEIGSGVGYSALWLMRGRSPTTTLDAIEYSPKVAKTLGQVVMKAGLEKRVMIHQGAALSILPGLKGPYDLVFIDADKDEYPTYLEHALRLTQAGSIIMADNMLWGGTVVQGKKAEGAQGIWEYTKRIFADSRLTSLIVPLGDGLAVSYRVK